MMLIAIALGLLLMYMGNKMEQKKPGIVGGMGWLVGIVGLMIFVGVMGGLLLRLAMFAF